MMQNCPPSVPPPEALYELVYLLFHPSLSLSVSLSV